MHIYNYFRAKRHVTHHHQNTCTIIVLFSDLPIVCLATITKKNRRVRRNKQKTNKQTRNRCGCLPKCCNQHMTDRSTWQRLINYKQSAKPNHRKFQWIKHIVRVHLCVCVSASRQSVHPSECERYEKPFIFRVGPQNAAMSGQPGERAHIFARELYIGWSLWAGLVDAWRNGTRATYAIIYRICCERAGLNEFNWTVRGRKVNILFRNSCCISSFECFNLTIISYILFDLKLLIN